MFREKIPARQLSAWLFAAITPPLIQLLGGTPWPLVVALTAISVIIVCIRWRWGGEITNRWLGLAHYAFLIILLGTLSAESAKGWPIGDNFPAVPLILLVLAAWSAQKGVSAAARVGCVLFWFILLMYLALFGAGVKNVQFHWIKPTSGRINWLSAIVLLTPAAAAVFLRNEDAFKPRLLLTGVFAICAALITAGTLSPQVANRMENAFYEMTRSLSIMGVARRFEAVVSAGVTVGWFLLLSLFLSVCGKLAEELNPEWGRIGVWVSAGLSASWLLCGLHITGWILTVFAAVFWVLLPLLIQGLGAIKKSKKSENTP